jgi:hypothetical protein
MYLARSESGSKFDPDPDLKLSEKLDPDPDTDLKQKGSFGSTILCEGDPMYEEKKNRNSPVPPLELPPCQHSRWTRPEVPGIGSPGAADARGRDQPDG